VSIAIDVDGERVLKVKKAEWYQLHKLGEWMSQRLGRGPRREVGLQGGSEAVQK
jgi:hypothetical protein